MTNFLWAALAFIVAATIWELASRLVRRVNEVVELKRRLKEEQDFADELEQKLDAAKDKLEVLEARVKKESPLKLTAELRERVDLLSTSNSYELRMSEVTRQDFLRALEPDVYYACISGETEMVFGMPIKTDAESMPYRELKVVCTKTGRSWDVVWRVFYG